MSNINGLEITDVRVFPFQSTGKTKAFVSITFNGQFVVKEIRVVEGSRGLFVSYPQKHNKKSDEYEDIAHPITSQFRAYITEEIIAAYNAKINETIPASQKMDPDYPMSPAGEPQW